MKRAVLIILDSLGVGALPDAHLYGDEGANTLGNIAKATKLRLPNLQAMGLGHIPQANLPQDPGAKGAYGRMAERSPGKDTTTGHWEIAGVQLKQPFPTFPDGFPGELMAAYEAAIGSPTLGNYAASGTAIIQELGPRHVETGYPIVYTSADSVFQIAAHEEVIPPQRLYKLCQTARELLRGPWGVGRVIARPFVGDARTGFTRTGNRRDFSLDPIAPTILDVLKEGGKEVLAVGKIEDIFNFRGITRSNHAAGNAACIRATLEYLDTAFDGLCFVNLVDTDMIYGHRRDAEGYRASLEQFDAALPQIAQRLQPQDLLIITADHGCDPTFHGTDHTREYVPLIAWHPGMDKLCDLGTRCTFADVAATISAYFGFEQRFEAQSFLDQIKE
ncbi:MAG: phosphopentomutase [Clostridiales bacterium]|nr:phosphopentomutase [Clostridiales bacterium]